MGFIYSYSGINVSGKINLKIKKVFLNIMPHPHRRVTGMLPNEGIFQPKSGITKGEHKILQYFKL